MNGRILVLLLSTALVTATISIAAAEDSESTPAEIAASRSPKELIGISAEKSQTASTERDFAEMIYYLNRSLASEAILPKHRDYAQKLKGWAHNRLGEAFAEKGKEEAALVQFESAVELNPTHWKAVHNRGVSYAIRQRFDEALQDFSATTRLNPAYPNAWFNRGEIYMRIGQPDVAVVNYSKAIQLNSEDASYYLSRGRSFHYLEQHRRALADFNQALQLDPKLISALVERGDLLVEQGQYDQAAEDYRAALKANDQFAAAYRSVAWMMATCSDIRFRDADRAVTFAQKAIRLHGQEDYRYLDTLAAALANAEQFDAALQQQRLAITVAAKKATGRDLQFLQNRLQQYEQHLPHRQERVATRPGNPSPVQ